jgi:dTDP-glucose 4,6-dehydratase
MGQAMRVLITGGRGFAGRHTIDHFLKTTDWDIVSLDGRRGERQVSDRLTRINHDLRFPINSLIDVHLGHIDGVVHLAASADVHKFIEDPMTHVLNNVHSIMHMLEWARTRQLTHFILGSTNEIYGPSTKRNGTVEWSTVVPPTTYSASKASQEALAISYWRTYGVPLVITNTMQLFGHDQPEERFIPTVVKRLWECKPVELFGDPRRCWTFVDNYADALRWLLGRPVAPWPDYKRPARWNIAGPEYSCRELAERIAQIMEISNYHITEAQGLARPGHEERYALDSWKIEGAGWRGSVGFQRALEETVVKIRDRIARGRVYI